MGTHNLGSPHITGKTLSDNLTSSFLNDYPVTRAGYFGEVGSNSKVRIIYSDNVYITAKDFYERVGKGAISTRKIPHGKVSALADGTIITYRAITSSEGSPAININIKKGSYKGRVKTQKIHFVTNKGGTN